MKTITTSTPLTDPIRIMANWVNERHNIYLKKERGECKPWTTDPILQAYRFCNVYRELDKESKWIHQNWLYPNEQQPLLYLNMALARFINWSPTLAEIGYQYDWNPERLKTQLKVREATGNKLWTGAYIVSTNGRKMGKIDYIVDFVLTPLAEKGRNPVNSESLELYWEFLTSFDGIGSFMAAQIVADLKFARPMSTARDWWSWAAMGPGSKRGINRVLGRDKDSPIKQEQFLLEITRLRNEIKPLLGNHITEISAQDMQNVCCEFDKVMRVLNNEGKPRSSYAGN